MSITADPLFIAAEVQWRTQNLSAARPAVRAEGHRHGVRAALGVLHRAHRHERSHGRPGSPRTA